MKNRKPQSASMAFLAALLPLLAIWIHQANSESCRKISEKTWVDKVGGCDTPSGPPGFDPDCFFPEWNGDIEEFYEEYEHTETISICFADACSGGEEKVEEDEHLIGSGTEWCEDWSILPLPEADPELCEGCGCDEDECEGPSTSSIVYRMRLGAGLDGKSPYYIYVHQEKIEDHLFTPKILDLRGAKGLRVYRNADYTIRQILGQSVLADVVVLSDRSFKVDLYPVADIAALERDENGFLIPQGEPVRSHVFSDPQLESGPGFQIVAGYGKSKRRHLFTWNRETDKWTLQSGNKAPLLEEVVENYDEATGTFTKTKFSTDAETGISQETIRTFRDFSFGRRIVSTEKRIAGKTVSRDEYAYHDEQSPSGSLGRLKSRKLHDGSWERFEYDREGRLAKTIRPWKNSPFESAENEVKVEAHSHLSVPGSSPYYHPLAQFVRTDTLVQGTKVATTHRLQSSSLVDGSVVKIEERAAQPGGRFGAEGNQRTETHFYPIREADPASGKMKSRQTPDGRLVSYTYESGDYTGEEGVPGNFEPRIGGYHTRTTMIEGRVGHPNGFPQKTVAQVTIQSPAGKLLLQESRIRPEGSDDYSVVLDWTGYAYDVFDRRKLARNSTGIIGEYRYNPCCGKLEWERNAKGIETYYVRDDADRVTSRIVSAPDRPDLETHYEYDFLGNVTKEIVASGELVLETTRKYDEEGLLVEKTSPDGLVTRYEHDHANRRDVTILPGNTTRVEDRYLDGRTRAVQGTAVVAQFYDYGVKKDTGDQWTETVVAKADGPRWNRSYTDALGRAFYSEQPGHGDNVVLASINSYDTQGRLIATATGWKTVSAMGGADDDKDGVVTLVVPPILYAYDPDTGELLRSGQDVDRNNKLEPGSVDQISGSETSFAKIGNHWFNVTRAYSYPVELTGEPYLVSETRKRVTGLGSPQENQGILVGESISRAPGKEEGEFLTATSRTYLDRETATAVTVTESPTGLVSRQVTKGGLVTESTESDPQDPISKIQTLFSYDSLGRRISTTDPRTGESKTAYDPDTGRLIAQVDPEGRETKLEYYPADHKSAGKLSATINAEGKRQFAAYNARGQQTGVWGDTTQPIAYRYNEYGEMVGLQTFQTLPNGDPSTEPEKGSQTNWHYHEATGTLLHKEYADGNGPKYDYTESGQLKTRLWARKKISEDQRESAVSSQYTYDDLTGALVQTTYSDATEITYTYDDSHRLTQVTDPTGTRKFTYDIRGQITSETVTLNTGEGEQPIHYRINRDYTNLGQPARVALQDLNANPGSGLQHEVDYNWNKRGQLASVKSLAGEFAFQYDQTSPALLTKMTGPSHSVETTYEPHRNLVTGVVNRRNPGGAISALPTAEQQAISDPISTYSYKNDLLGRRTAISQGGQAFALLNLGESTIDVAYNDRSEVTGATTRRGDTPVAHHQYAYDGIGNRTRSVAEVGGQKSEVSYQANALNQYKTISEDQRKSAVSHDLDGNLVEDDRNRYSWNGENRLVQVDSKDGNTRVEYQYDYQGRRTVKRTTRDEQTETTYFVWDGWNLLAEETKIQNPKSNDADTVRTYTWGRDLSGSLQGAGGVGGLLAINEGGEHRYPAYDANGNVGQLLDQDGEAVAAYSYDPFGNVTEMAGEEAANNPWRFSTKPVEQETGWSYYGFRYYMPETGRWASRDPIAERGGVNLYGFVGNDGVGEFDFLGFLEHSGVSWPRTAPHTDWQKTCYYCEDTLAATLINTVARQNPRCCGKILQHPGSDGQFAGCCNGVPYTGDQTCCKNGSLVDKIPLHERDYASLEMCLKDKSSPLRDSGLGAAGGLIGYGVGGLAGMGAGGLLTGGPGAGVGGQAGSLLGAAAGGFIGTNAVPWHQCHKRVCPK